MDLSRPIYHIQGDTDPDTFCSVLEEDGEFDPARLGIVEHPDWHHGFCILPYDDCEGGVWNINCYGLTDSDEWFVYRDGMYDAVDNFLYECKQVAKCQPYDRVDEDKLRTQLRYNRQILVDYLEYMAEETGRRRDNCEDETEQYYDYADLCKWARETLEDVRDANVNCVVSAPVRIDYDFIF